MPEGQKRFARAGPSQHPNARSVGVYSLLSLSLSLAVSMIPLDGEGSVPLRGVAIQNTRLVLATATNNRAEWACLKKAEEGRESRDD